MFPSVVQDVSVDGSDTEYEEQLAEMLVELRLKLSTVRNHGHDTE